MTAYEQEFTLNGKNASATGVLSEKGFLVKAGSLARAELVPSAQNWIHMIRDQLLTEGVLENQGDQLRFTRDFLFNSPSGGAMAVLGRNANGWTAWKSSNGETLSQVHRVAKPDLDVLSEAKRREIQQLHQSLEDEGQLRSQKRIDQEYARFQERFGPSALKGMDGEQLLTFMHDHSNKDSLVFWLEWKGDEEFSTRSFGGIAGGSALKFRVFRRKETGNWQAGGKQGNRPEDITLEEAIEYARTHRDQLIAGCELLEELPRLASDEEYAELQDQLDELAPDVSRLAWGHKYFSLMYPGKLDDYHVPAYQRFHLLKLLQSPPDGDGRYICAGRFVAVASEVGLSLNHLTTTLGRLHGGPHRYWRIGTTSGKSGESYWQMMQDEKRIAVGWSDLGDLSWVDSKKNTRERLREELEASEPRHPSAIGRDCSQIVHFIADIAEGDLVLAANGMDVLGIGRVTGEYEHHPEFGFPHQRPVEWLNTDEWRMPSPREGLQSTVRELKKFNDNLLAIEERVQQSDSIGRRKPEDSRDKNIRLAGVQGRIQSVLERKGQVILYGPPGTGKTYWAEKTAHDLAAVSAFGKRYEAIDDTQKREVIGNGGSPGLVRLCCFHPAYGYEDFIEGYRPETIDGQVSFSLRDGVFKKLCEDARSSPQRSFYLIVDEINRGDIPRIFGELLTTLEKDKRGKPVVLPVSQEVLRVPPNVFLIGTMNTADRSISLLDAALRRRFGFVEMMPDGNVLKASSVKGIPLRAWFDELNSRIRQHVGRDARNLQIGHSYLMHAGSPLKEMATFKRAVRDDIIPLLEEYCYEDYSTLASILGDQLVDSVAQRICHELFDEGQEDKLVQALLAPCPDISASSEAVSSEEASIEGDDSDDDDPVEDSEP